MDTAQWPQGMGSGARPMVERRTRPQKDQALNCPRCNSTNTKFCYYNNYSLTQPRYFCKTCRRYWTEGGSLRNVPVGGGSRKNKKTTLSSSSSSSLSSPASSKKLSDPNNPPSFPESAASQNPKINGGQDLNLAYPPPTQEGYNNLSKFVDQNPQNPSSSSTSSHLSAMEFLKTGISSGGLSSFMQMPVSDNSNMMYSSGFPMQEFKPTLNFSLDGFDQSGYGGLQGVQESSGARLFFPIEDLKQQVSSTTGFEQNRGQGDHSTGYWNGMLGGGSW